jgi:3-methyladenine DNA glycosylase/8-oxoguanine DNA glycosylase
MPLTRAQMAEASAALAARDPVIAMAYDQIGPAAFGGGRRKYDHFGELARAILFQQLAGAAARTIHGRFSALFDGDPTPEAVVAMPMAKLRQAGLSAAKAASVRDLAEKVLGGTVQLKRIGRLPDDEIVRELTAVRGIGRWTAEMFLIFRLGRLDVWPVDDLAVRKGYGMLYRLRETPTAKALDPLGEPLRPYRSIAAWYCWRATDTITL